MKKEPADRKATGSVFRWKPDLAVFTDINIPKEYFEDTLKRQAVVNAGVTFTFRNQEGGKFVKTDYCYPNGILDYVNEIAGEQTLTMPQFWEAERKGRDREDKPEYKVRISAALCFSNRVNRLEYYHNSSWLEHGARRKRPSRMPLSTPLTPTASRRTNTRSPNRRSRFRTWPTVWCW